MARKPGERFPSDHRRWFRVMEDVLDDPKLASEKDEWLWGAWLRILASLNRTKSRDGILRVNHAGLCALMGRRRADVALKRLQRGANVGLYSAARYADYTLILVSKWPELQEIAPVKPQRDPNETPAPTPTPTPTPIKKRERTEDGAGASAPTNDWLLQIIGKEPGKPEEKAAWLERERPLLEEFAERDYPDDPKKRNRELRSRVFRHYRQHLKSRGEASTSEDGKAMGESTRRAIAQAEREKAERDRLAAEAQR